MALTEARSRLPERAVPTRFDATLFQFKVHLFRAHRFFGELGRRPAWLAKGEAAAFEMVVSEHRSALWSDPRPDERALQWGKVQNLRVAARLLDRTILPQGAVFSFWRQIGRAGATKGFVAGRMLQEGCLVPATGGGLCQLSNALYDAALTAGCEIVERHAHSRLVPGSRAAAGRDATVAWNYVDLRFAAPQMLMLRVELARDELVVRLLAPPHATGKVGKSSGDFLSQGSGDVVAPYASSCGTCDETNCFRHEGGSTTPVGRTAFLVDENWPEFRSYVASTRRNDDVLALPINGSRSPRYAWDTNGFARVMPAAFTALMRSVRLRFAKDAPARRAAELGGAEALARRLARTLTPDVTDVVVAQSLLPFPWPDGHLGGRRFSVLMTRMPMAEIEVRLNAAAMRHHERRSLADFRADPALIADERAALAAADAIVTPHAEIARLFGERAVQLDWVRPEANARTGAVVPRRIAFPGPTIARKGAYELREAARSLDLEVVLVGSELEGADFWSGVRTRRAGPANWLDGVTAVVQPALLEDAPRKLLEALASGVPVIATPACGLPPQMG
ncbi:MAG TPA: VanW family protein, partial [Rhizomicrobium sp.]|nr:VanW family protein [Rhizomicrobium sp.]